MRRKHSDGTPSTPQDVDAQGQPLAPGPLDRRAFLTTTSAILAAASVLPGCEGDVSTLGAVNLTISGLPLTLLDWGRAVITRTDATGFPPIDVTVPTGAIGEASVTTGTYHVDYTPPTGYHVVGSASFDVVVEVGETTDVTVVCEVDGVGPPPDGTLRVTVTGVDAGAGGGGSASLLRTDIAGQSPLVVNIPVAGTLNTLLPPGTYQVTYTPPANHTVNGGVTNPATASVTSSTTTTVTFAVTFTNPGFPTPDIRNNVSFEAGFDGFVNGSFQPPTGVSRDQVHANIGSFAVRKALPVTSGSDVGGSFFFPFYAGAPFMPVAALTLDRAWGRFYFYFDAAMNGILKFQIWEAPSFSSQFGGFYCEGGSIGWAFIQEWNSQIHRFTNIGPLVNGWHYLECDYWRNGDPSGFPSVGIWLDGNQITSGQGNPPSPGAWTGGRLNAGQRGSSGKLGSFNLIGVLNGTPNNTVAGNVWVDRVSISSLGRIGP